MATIVADPELLCYLDYPPTSSCEHFYLSSLVPQEIRVLSEVALVFQFLSSFEETLL